jgi:hypothetical protein
MNRKWQRFAMAATLATAGVIVGANMSTTNQAHGEISATPEPPAFQSGGQQSVPILREISSTLRQIDSRLARLEIVAQKLKTESARKSSPAATTAGAGDVQ